MNQLTISANCIPEVAKLYAILYAQFPDWEIEIKSESEVLGQALLIRVNRVGEERPYAFRFDASAVNTLMFETQLAQKLQAGRWDLDTWPPVLLGVSAKVEDTGWPRIEVDATGLGLPDIEWGWRRWQWFKKWRDNGNDPFTPPVA